MSLNDPNAPYYTPPPKKKTSPWVYVGVSCLVITLVVVGGCVGLGVYMGNQIREGMKKPINEQEVMASLKGVPLYPGATLDVDGTKAMRAGMGIVNGFSGGKVKFKSGSFRVDATTDKITTWYDQKLGATGWQQAVTMQNVPGTASGTLSQHQYVKNGEQLVVQAQAGTARPSKTGDTRNILNLTVVTGVGAR